MLSIVLQRYRKGCKTSIHRFDSDRRLFPVSGEQAVVLKCGGSRGCAALSVSPQFRFPTVPNLFSFPGCEAAARHSRLPSPISRLKLMAEACPLHAVVRPPLSAPATRHCKKAVRSHSATRPRSGKSRTGRPGCGNNAIKYGVLAYRKVTHSCLPLVVTQLAG